MGGQAPPEIKVGGPTPMRPPPRFHHLCIWQWLQEAEVQAHPQKFWFGENSGKVCKICETLPKSPKIWANTLKIRAKMAPNLLWFEKNGAQSGQNDMKTFFLLEVIPKWSSWKSVRVFAQNVAQNYFSKFGKIRAKILCTPKNLPAPTPMTYDISKWFSYASK